VTILLISGLVGMLLYGRISGSSSPPAGSDRPKQKSTIIKSIAPLLAMGRLFHSLPVDASLLVVLALEFFKIGLLMFGGGLVIAPLLQQELVDSQHWLTTKQLLDGIALGQLTPGPVTVVATFAGYATAGFAGGLVATVAVFLPAFILVLGLSPVLLRVRDVPLVKGFLKGITAGALGAIAAAAIIFARAAIFDVVTLAIAFVSLLLLIRWNINTIVLIAGAAIVGLLRLFL
jgi:chromate transporter